MKYAVSYIEDNGYRCSCCGHSEKYKEHFETLDEAVEFAARIQFLGANPSSLSELSPDLLSFVPDGFRRFDENDGYELVQIHGLHNKHILKDPEVQQKLKDWEKKLKREILAGFDAMSKHFRQKRLKQYKKLKREFEDVEYDENFTCDDCPRRKFVNTPKLECDGLDCINNYHRKG